METNAHCEKKRQPQVTEKFQLKLLVFLRFDIQSRFMFMHHKLSRFCIKLGNYTSKSIEQLALNEVYVTVHFVSPGAHRAGLAIRCAIHLARTARHHQMYQREDFNKKILL